MATYSYKCTECDHTFDVKQSMKDEPLRFCPVCDEEALCKVISPAGGFRIGGAGVYKPTSGVD